MLLLAWSCILRAKTVGWWTWPFQCDVFRVHGSSFRLLPEWNNLGCYHSRSLVMGGDWGLLLLCADFHLVPWMVPLPRLQWFPGCPSLESSSSCPDDKPPAFIQQRNSCLPSGGEQYCLIAASLIPTPSEEAWVSNSWVLEGALQGLAICSTQYSPSKSATTHLPKFGDAFNILFLSASFSLGALLFLDCQSVWEVVYSTDSSQTAWVWTLALPVISCDNLGKFLKHWWLSSFIFKMGVITYLVSVLGIPLVNALKTIM